MESREIFCPPECQPNATKGSSDVFFAFDGISAASEHAVTGAERPHGFDFLQGAEKRAPFSRRSPDASKTPDSDARANEA